MKLSSTSTEAFTSALHRGTPPPNLLVVVRSRCTLLPIAASNLCVLHTIIAVSFVCVFYATCMQKKGTLWDQCVWASILSQRTLIQMSLVQRLLRVNFFVSSEEQTGILALLPTTTLASARKASVEVAIWLATFQIRKVGVICLQKRLLSAAAFALATSSTLT